MSPITDNEAENPTSPEIWSSEERINRRLPPRFRLLCVVPYEPSWVNLTLQLDAEGCLEPQFRWVSTPNEALIALRDESFDCIIICDSLQNSTASSKRDFQALLQAIPASGCDDPIVFVTEKITDSEWGNLCQTNCELLLSPNHWESQALVPVIKRAVAKVELTRENHRLTVLQHRRLLRERDEADHLLKQQRQILSELQAIVRSSVDHHNNDQVPPTQPIPVDSPTGSQQSTQLPEEINTYYHELLRTYVIMGSGNLGSEIAKLAKLLSVADLRPREVLALHLERVETLVKGLGNRSTRHIMARADLLALELMIHLGECYQQKL